MPKYIKKQLRLGGVEAGSRKGWFRDYSGSKGQKEKLQVK